MKKLLFSITPKDCTLQTFTVGGHGGAGKDTSNTGVRWIHIPSGAVGEAREERSQHQNKVAAWKRMANDPRMKHWIRLKLSNTNIDDWVDAQMQPSNLKVEVKSEDGKWVEVDVQ